MKISFILPIILAVFTTSASALGINCRGSAFCNGKSCGIHHLKNSIDKMPDYVKFAPGQQIACCDSGAGNICAFTQHTKQHITGKAAKVLIKGIVDHGCKKCGSNPFRDNNVKKGELTVNYVDGIE